MAMVRIHVVCLQLLLFMPAVAVYCGQFLFYGRFLFFADSCCFLPTVADFCRQFLFLSTVSVFR